MTALITPALVRLDADLGSDHDAVIRGLAAVLGEAGRAHDVDRVAADVLAREGKSPTGLPGGIALPHARTAGVEVPTLAFARLREPVEFGAAHGASDLVVLITAPTTGDATHLQLLTKLARALVKPAFTDALRAALSAEQVVDQLDAVLSPAR
jgi:fructose PTS system EIIBC or EIIC component